MVGRGIGKARQHVLWSTPMVVCAFCLPACCAPCAGLVLCILAMLHTTSITEFMLLCIQATCN